MTIGVVGERRDGKLTRESCEAICRAVQLKKQLAMSVELVLMEPKGVFDSPWIDRWGADRVVVYDLADSERWNMERKLSILEKYVQETKPAVLLFAGSIQGQEFAPRLATRIGASGLVDCVTVSADSKSKGLSVTKPIYGGNAYGEYCVMTPCFLALRARQIKLEEKGEVAIPVEWREAVKAQGCDSIVSRRLQSAAGHDLEDKKILFVCGRGIGNKENLERIKGIAEISSAGVAGTKKAIENGWLPLEVLVGQTGKILAPELCIVLGASGATPFVHGIAGAEKIIAINKDEDARIFEVSDLGRSDDCEQVIAAIERKLEEIL